MIKKLNKKGALALSQIIILAVGITAIGYVFGSEIGGIMQNG